MNHQLTKTDFIQYLNCPKSLWLLKNKPEDYEKGEMSLFLEKLITEGYEVEEQAQKLIPNGITLPNFGDPGITKQALEENGTVFFQASFQTESGAFARMDVLEKLDDGTFHIYEIKSSTSISRKKNHDHLKDACFQKHVMTECGYEVSKVSIIHLNKEYVRSGDINPSELLVIEDVTDEIAELYDSVSSFIVDALKYINKEEISLTHCPCREDTRSHHCDSFKFFNTDIPEYSIYEMNRISQKRIRELVDIDTYRISDIPSDYEGLNEKHRLHRQSVIEKQAIINTKAIKESIDILDFPLHFIDYETYASAVPKIDKVGPHQQIVFQVSIHTMQEGGEINHYEYLADELELPKKLIQYMRSVTGDTGTYISWNASFEKTQNKTMTAWFPQYADYLNTMNLRMYDLMDIFKKDYMDYRFHGSSSIKKVLPVICPELNYNDLDVQNGTMALDTWGRMVLDTEFPDDIETTRKNLLEYCGLDTLAMVELYKKLSDIINKNNFIIENSNLDENNYIEIILQKYKNLPSFTNTIELITNKPSRALPNKIQINIKNKNEPEILKTIIHEQMHLFIQKNSYYQKLIDYMKTRYEDNGECNTSGTYPNSFWEHIAVCWNTRNILFQLLDNSIVLDIYQNSWQAYPQTEKLVEGNFIEIKKILDNFNMIYKKNLD